MRKESSVSFKVQTFRVFLTTNSIKKIIDTLTGEPGRAGDSLASVTESLTAYRVLNHEQYGSRIVFVDTPGFDDSERPDEQILEEIGKWLVKTYVEFNDHNYTLNPVYTDTREKFSYRGLCMCKISPIRGCLRHLTALWSCLGNSLVWRMQRALSL